MQEQDKQEGWRMNPGSGADMGGETEAGNGCL